jgi:hypothetical protein
MGWTRGLEQGSHGGRQSLLAINPKFVLENIPIMLVRIKRNRMTRSDVFSKMGISSEV